MASRDDSILVQAKGAKELLIGIENLALFIVKPRELADQVGAALLARIQRRFIDKQVDPDGVEWIVSKAAIRREAQGRGGKTGFDTGRLFRSIQLFRDSDSVRRIGTNVPYARKFQEGGEGQPPRVFLGFGEDDTRFAEFVIKQAMDKALEDVVKGKKPKIIKDITFAGGNI